MANGDSRAAWDIVFKVSQVAVLPLLAAMFYMLMQVSSLDRRLAIIEVTTRNPQMDVGLTQKIAIIEDRQNEVRNQLKLNGEKIDRIEDKLDSRFNPTYKSIPRER